MRAHTPVHQTSCVLLSANGYGVGVKPCPWNMTPRVCIANRDWWKVTFLFLKGQRVSSHFPRRSRSPQALLPGMAGKQIEGSSTKRWISASSVQGIQDAQAEATIGTRCARRISRLPSDRLGGFFEHRFCEVDDGCERPVKLFPAEYPFGEVHTAQNLADEMVCFLRPLHFFAQMALVPSVRVAERKLVPKPPATQSVRGICADYRGPSRRSLR
jgi:hypothetical protein